MISISLKAWDDIPTHTLKAYLHELPNETNALLLKARLLQSIIRYQHPIDLADCISMVDDVDLSFLKEYPTKPLFNKFRIGLRTYYCGQEKLMTATGREFYLIDHYYNDYTKDGDPKSLFCLMATIWRKKAKLHQQIIHEDIREPIISKHQVELNSKHFYRSPPYIAMATLLYASASLSYINNIYGPILGGKSNTEGVDLGWEGTFMSIAETGTFGDIESVYDKNIHRLLVFLIKKKQEADEMERASSNEHRIL